VLSWKGKGKKEGNSILVKLPMVIKKGVVRDRERKVVHLQWLQRKGHGRKKTILCALQEGRKRSSNFPGEKERVILNRQKGLYSF